MTPNPTQVVMSNEDLARNCLHRIAARHRQFPKFMASEIQRKMLPPAWKDCCAERLTMPPAVGAGR